MAKDILYPYAFDENNDLVFIQKYTKETCHLHTFHCPNCSCLMIPRWGEHNTPHFAHAGDQKCDGESYIHKAAKLILARRFNERSKPFKIALAPEGSCIHAAECPTAECNCRVPHKTKEYDLLDYFDKPANTEVVIKEPNGKHFTPDVMLCSSSPDRESIFIEVYYKHKVTEYKKESGHRIIEFRVRELVDLKELEDQECFTESKDILFYSFNCPVTPEQITEYLIDYSRECGVELPPDGLPPCKRDPISVIKYCRCNQCSGHLVLRNGKYGQFFGCSNYPRCRFTARLPEKP